MARTAARANAHNHLLSLLSVEDSRLLESSLEPVELKLRTLLEESNRPIKAVYFLSSGIASVVATGGRKRQIEVGIIGREGMSGINVVMGDRRSPHRTYMQVAGEGQRIAADTLWAAIEKSISLRNHLLNFAQAFMLQTAYTALANGQGHLEERLARWVLMAHDRVEGDELALTHEFLSLMLSVRRPGVTVALQQLEQRGFIRAKRATIAVLNRRGLAEVANGLYGVPEAEYRRLTGWRAKV